MIIKILGICFVLMFIIFVCVQFFKNEDETSRCSYGICDGSGWDDQQYGPDDIEKIKCPCNEDDTDDNSEII